MNLLYLHLSDRTDDARGWLRQDGGVSDLGRGPLAQFGQQHPGLPCVVFLPTARCLLVRAQVSARQLRQAGDALSWLVEDQAGEDADSLHVVAGPSEEGDTTALLATSREGLATLVAELRAAGLHPLAVLPDLMLLPRDDSDWQLRVNDGQASLRTGVLAGAVLEAELLPLLLDAAWAERGPGALTISLAAGDPDTAARVEEWAGGREGVSLRLSEQLDAATALQAEADWAGHAGNLLRGAFASRARLALPATLRIAAAFLLAAFALQVLSEWVHYGYYRYQSGKVATEAVGRYRSLYPGENIAAKPAVAWQQVQQRMRGKRNEGSASSNDVLPALTRVAQSLQGSGLGTQRVDIQGGVLTLDVNARSLGELDGFKQQLDGQGFNTEIQSANNQGGVIRGRLRVEGGA